MPRLAPSNLTSVSYDLILYWWCWKSYCINYNSFLKHFGTGIASIFEILEFSPGHKGKCVMSKKEEERASGSYSVPKRYSSPSSPTTQSNEEKEQQSITLATQHDPQPEYINRAALTQLQNHVCAHGNNDDVIGTDPAVAQEAVSCAEEAKNYEIRGGFALPKTSTSEEESNYIRYPDFQTETCTGLPNHQAACQIPAVKSKSNDVVEDPYVQAPPLKSHRCQPKFEKPHAYQMLVPNGCASNGCGPTDEGDEYNMLLHNSTVLSQDAKAFLLLNNNLKSTNINSENKCKVILKSHHPHNAAASKSKHEIKRNEMHCWWY